MKRERKRERNEQIKSMTSDTGWKAAKMKSNEMCGDEMMSKRTNDRIIKNNAREFTELIINNNNNYYRLMKIHLWLWVENRAQYPFYSRF